MGRKILIVDDSETSRLIIRKCYQMSGDEDSSFFEAEDGIRALSFLADNEVDLVVTDLNMPRMDGVTFLRKLRSGSKTKSLAVTVVSSMGHAGLATELAELGVTSIIRKPLSPAKVQALAGDF